MKFYKVWFSDGAKRTGQLIVDTERYPINTSVSDYSRLFPISEARIMKRLHVGDLYDTFDEAFTGGKACPKQSA